MKIRIESEKDPIGIQLKWITVDETGRQITPSLKGYLQFLSSLKKLGMQKSGVLFFKASTPIPVTVETLSPTLNALMPALKPAGDLAPKCLDVITNMSIWEVKMNPDDIQASCPMVNKTWVSRTSIPLVLSLRWGHESDGVGLHSLSGGQVVQSHPL